MDGVAHERIAGTDQDDDKNQPDGRFSDKFSEGIDQARELE